MADREELIAAVDRLRARLADFDSDAADAHAIGERADLWTEIEVDVNDLRALLRAQPAGVKVRELAALRDWLWAEIDKLPEGAASLPAFDHVLNKIDADLSALEPAALSKQEAVAWPDGFFIMEPRTRLYECATEGCGQRTSIRVERDGVGSNYCEPCARKIAALPASPVPAEPSAGWRAITDECRPTHNQRALLAWRDWRDGAWCMEVAAFSTGQHYENGYSSVSEHGSATHWMPLPTSPEREGA